MCSTSCSCDVACAPARARCWKRPGPGASTGTLPTSRGPAKPSDSAISLGTASHKEAPDSSTVRCQYNREGREALEISKRCLRRKARGALRPRRAPSRTCDSYGLFQEQKGLIPPSAHHIEKNTSTPMSEGGSGHAKIPSLRCTATAHLEGGGVVSELIHGAKKRRGRGQARKSNHFAPGAIHPSSLHMACSWHQNSGPPQLDYGHTCGPIEYACNVAKLNCLMTIAHYCTSIMYCAVRRRCQGS